MRSSIGSRPPASPGGRCCRSARPTARARPTPRRRRSRPGRACWRSRRRRSAPAEIAAFRARARLLDRRLGALRRPGRRGRPGALRARVERAAALRGRARRPADRRHPALRRAAQRRSPRAPRALPARRRGGRAARRAQRRPGSSGAIRSTTGRRCGAAVTAGGSSACGARPSSPTWPASTTSAASSPTGRCPRAPAAPAAGRWRRGPGRGGLRGGAARARRAAADRGGPRRDHAGGRAAAARNSGCPAWSCCNSASAAGRDNPHRPENHVELLVVYTGTHDTETAVGWWDSLDPRGASRDRARPAEPHWSLIELALASAPRSPSCPRRTCSGLGSEARMNRPGTTRGQLALAARAEGQLTAALAARLRARDRAATRGRVVRGRHGRAARPCR